MTKYIVTYQVSNDYEILIEAENEEEAKEKAELKIDPNNEYDWSKILYVEKLP